MDLQIQFTRIGVPIPPPSSLPDHDLRFPESLIPSENDDSSSVDEEDVEHNDPCRTPRSAKNRIPQFSSPPPAPKKKRQPPVSKRKLRMDLDQFFEIVNRSDELDEFFRSGFEFAERIAKRSKCRLMA